MKQDENKQLQNRSLTKYTSIFVVIVICVVGFFLVTGDVMVRFDNNMLYIKGSYWADQSIQYEDIQSITYMEDLKVGYRTNGLGSFKLKEGHFKNEQFGHYILYSYIKCKSYIAIRTTSEIFVINGKSKQETETLYKDLLERLER